MRKCKTDFKWPANYFPARLCVLNEETGEERNFCLVFSRGRLTVEEEKAPEETKPAGAAEKTTESPVVPGSETV